MTEWLNIENLNDFLATSETWIRTHVLVLANLVQVVVIAAAYGIAVGLGHRLSVWLGRILAGSRLAARAGAMTAHTRDLAVPLLWLALVWLAVVTAIQIGESYELLRVAANLLIAWVVIRFTSGFIRDAALSRAVAVVAWTLAALSVLGLLQPAVNLLDGLAINFGAVRVSILTVLKAVVILAVLLWAALLLSRTLEKRIGATTSLTPSIQVLLSKLLKIALVTIALVVAVSSVGIDLSAFALFGGAVGVGLGFGLQKVVSNLVSGVILLMDKSIKPGDVIAVGETFGWINSLGARYASVITRDGVEHLIPNEDLITQRVENWSYSNTLVRQKVSIGISYKSDPRKARELVLQAAANEDRVLNEPPPVCHLVGFGDNSVDLELRFWIRDPVEGIANIKNQVLLAVWDLFHENGVEFPFPQRDVHIVPPAELDVTVSRKKE